MSTNDEEKQELEGEVNNPKLTPITKRAISEVHADRWNTMTIMELYDQKVILDNRMYIACQIGNSALIQQLQMGIGHLTNIINQKSDQDIKLI